MEAAEAAGNVIQGVAGYNMGRFNGKVADQNARVAGQDSAAQQEMVINNARQAMGAQLATQGTGGFELGTGSNLDALQNSAMNRELDLMTLRRQGQAKMDAYQLDAANDRATGQAAFMHGIFGAVAALNKGFENDAYQKAQAYGPGGGGSSSSFAMPADYQTNFFGN